jgi:tripartite-type tricarboxylate transporter receptor subunit TctC
MQNCRVTRRGLIGGAILTPLLARTALAEGGLIKFVVGLAAGGAVDPYARIVADRMSKILGQTIIVENKPGAGGNLSAQYMVDAPADGSMVWVSTQALTEINPSAYKNLRWSIDQFTPIIKGIEASLVFVVNPRVPARTLAEFLAWAKANRGKLSYSSYTAGTPSHFLGFQMNEKFDLDMVHVPYRGSGLQATALISGEAQFGFAQINSSLPQVRAGELRALAVTGPVRDRSLPDVPTFAELGYPEFTAKVWFGRAIAESW